jgi:hypothetical protein
MRFVDVFEGLNKRKPTTQEKLNFERLVTTLETTPNDAILSVLVAFEHYKTLYETIPNKINGVVTDTLKTVNDAAKEQAKLAVAETQKELAKAVAEASQKVAKSVAHGRSAALIGGSVITCAVSALLIMLVCLNIGEKNGFVKGYEQAKDEKAALAWSNTPEGKTAYKLAQAIDIRMLANCTGTGWEIKKNRGSNNACIPQPDNGKINGWFIPDQ